eukprot:GHVS01061163.1.p1 GENE.GHVS01061163.1~~GHVS01061163.1.p1  ORF type:complete len:192 (-),score=59.49 GHVS01061163.1:407-982(-)
MREVKKDDDESCHYDDVVVVGNLLYVDECAATTNGLVVVGDKLNCSSNGNNPKNQVKIIDKQMDEEEGEVVADEGAAMEMPFEMFKCSGLLPRSQVSSTLLLPNGCYSEQDEISHVVLEQEVDKPERMTTAECKRKEGGGRGSWFLSKLYTEGTDKLNKNKASSSSGLLSSKKGKKNRNNNNNLTNNKSMQ